MDSSPMADILSFDIDLRLIKLKKSFEKVDNPQTHLKRRLNEDIADARRRMRLGGVVGDVS